MIAFLWTDPEMRKIHRAFPWMSLSWGDRVRGWWWLHGRKVKLTALGLLVFGVGWLISYFMVPFL